MKHTKLKELRFYAGWTQVECAKKLKISQNYWSCLERNIFKPSKSLECRIKEMFGTEEIY